MPLWQELHEPIVDVCGNLTIGFHTVVLWQSSQVLFVAKWVGVLPVARAPLWQVKQVPAATFV